MPQNFYELAWIFLIYAFIGWCTEVSYAALDTGKFVNRGFLNGPYCPIYGFGVVIVVAILTPLKENLLILFVGSFILTTILEYITGFLLEKVFHNKWWDYSDKPFNIKGYVCLKFSIYWGLACTFIMDIVHPIIYKAVTTIPFVVGVVVLVILMTGFVVDACVTVSTILKFNKQLKLLNEVADQLHKLSDEIGENIYENVSTVAEKAEGARLVLDESKMEVRSEMEAKKAAYEEKKATYSETLKEKLQLRDELNEKYQKLLEIKNRGFKRLIKAFPDMKSKNENDALNRLKKYLKEKEEEKNKSA